ncbi:alpha/beta hydrolase [Peterkaempfera sp. SMS 1(5)a]|uniref:alpha/beta hydrolase n=1 Tax=Peterkaempfera podocarpi TaxID=3232308 RepID=UPI0036716AE1
MNPSAPRGGVPEELDHAGVRWSTAASAALGEQVSYWASVPAGRGPFPVLHLLHGRGDSYVDSLRLLGRVRAGEARGRFPPHVVVGVDAPWSARGSWYVDSVHARGRPVARALLDDVLPAVESALPVRDDRNARTVGGWSMGAAGAVRLALLRPEVFGRVLALSPAVYQGLPPGESNTRRYGAFGEGELLFSEERWRALHHGRLLVERDRSFDLHLALAAGDAEVPGSREAVLLRRALMRSGVEVDFRVLPGGHDWSVWCPAFDWAMEQLWSIRANSDKWIQSTSCLIGPQETKS